jgi:hypothetical protein
MRIEVMNSGKLEEMEREKPDIISERGLFYCLSFVPSHLP